MRRAKNRLRRYVTVTCIAVVRHSHMPFQVILFLDLPHWSLSLSLPLRAPHYHLPLL
eukprot:SAG11_NODE_30014_length_305_cov_0.650485_1_plen_56_part_10